MHISSDLCVWTRSATRLFERYFSVPMIDCIWMAGFKENAGLQNTASGGPERNKIARD